jgi:hypothetical protein
MKRNLITLTLIIHFSLIIIHSVYADTCNFPFPQNATYPYGIKPNNFTNAQMDQHCLDWFNKWKAKYVTQNNCTGSEWRLQRVETGNGITNGCYGFATAPNENDTVSEGIGYGMVIMVFMSSSTNNTKVYFDGMYTYFKDHLDGAGLMNWQIPYCSSGGSATDADEDVAFALLAADKQWGSGGTINYKNEADTIIGRILSNEISAANDIRPGDGWDGGNISYFAPYEYRMFGDYTSTARWYSVASHTYTTIINYYFNAASTTNAALGIKTGLQPNWCNYDGTTWSPGAWSMDYNSWWWDAIRHVWRQSYDYILYGTQDSELAYDNNARVSYFFKTKYNGDSSQIKSHYTLDGTETSYNRGDRTPDLGTEDVKNLPGPEGAVAISAMVEGDQDWLNNCYYTLVTMNAGTGSGNLTDTGVDWGTDYFCDILKMQYLLILTGNMPNPMGNYPTPTVTPTVTFGPSPTPVPQGIFDDAETGSLVNLDTSAGGQSGFTAVANTSDRPDTGLRSIKITSTNNSWGAYGEDSPYSGGLGYRNETGATALEFDIYSTAGITFFVKLVEGTANGADGETFASRGSQTTITANGWKHVSIPITNTAVFKRDDPNSVTGNNKLDLGAIKSFYFQIDSAPAATIWIDNITFTGTFPTATPTYTATKTRTPNGTRTNTPTVTVTSTNTPYFSPTITPTDTIFISATVTPTFTITATPTITPTFTLTPYMPFGVFDDFETGVLKNPATSDTGGGATLIISNSTVSVHGGTRSMQLVTTGANGWAVATLDSPYDGGLGYRNFTGATTFTFWINAPAATELFIKLVETNGQQWSDRGNVLTTGVAGWQQITITLSTLTVDQYSPAGDGDSVLDLDILKSVTFQFDNPGSKTVYIDDIKFGGMPTPTITPTPSRTPTATKSQTPTGTAQNTATYTFSATQTYSPSSTKTNTPLATATATQTYTGTFTATITGTSTAYQTNTPGNTPTWTLTPTRTSTEAITATYTLTASTTVTATFTPTYTQTYTATQTPTATPTYTATVTQTFTITQTHTVSPTITQTITGTPPTETDTPTVTQTCTATPSFTDSVSPTRTATQTCTMSFTPTVSMTNTPLPTATYTFTGTITPADTATASPTNTSQATASPTAQAQATATSTSQCPCTTATSTFTPTPVPTQPVFFIYAEKAYPCPYNPANGGLNLQFKVSKDFKGADIKIYTANFRLVRHDKFSQGGHAGTISAEIPSGEVMDLANGTYYYIIEAESYEGIQAATKIGILIIIR